MIKLFKNLALSLLLFSLTSCFDSEEVKLVKNGKLSNYKNKTVGEAVNYFFKKPKWEKINASDGETYVNVKGIIMYESKEVEAGLQFKIHKDKNSFELKGFELNEIPQNIFMLGTLLEKMYKNENKSVD
jgi:hypothetical protein